MTTWITIQRSWVQALATPPFHYDYELLTQFLPTTAPEQVSDSVGRLNSIIKCLSEVKNWLAWILSGLYKKRGGEPEGLPDRELRVWWDSYGDWLHLTRSGPDQRDREDYRRWANQRGGEREALTPIQDTPRKGK